MKASHTTTVAKAHYICWTDAAGASRWLAAIVNSPRGTWYVRAKTPDWLWSQLLPRQDNQIGVQEALAVLLLTESFSVLQGSLVTVLVDNDGVTAAFVTGQPDCEEVHAMVAVFWLAAAQRQTYYVFHRVESKANLADGPTRPEADGCVFLHQIHATQLDPLLPGWLVNLWAPFARDVLSQDAIALAAD